LHHFLKSREGSEHPFGARQFIVGDIHGQNDAAAGDGAVGCIRVQPLEGNSLAVFFDASGLSEEEMQSIAKEMNLSETTFICPRNAETELERGVRVRIFTVQEELHLLGIPRWERRSRCAETLA